ncbi:MAG: CARDB domain-containing protein, partial [Gammaproteobacteria bacterium]
PRAGTDPEFATWALAFDTSVAARWSLGPDQEVWSMGDFLLGGASPAIGAGMSLPVHPAFGPLPDSRASQEDLGAIPSAATAAEWEIFPFDQGWRGPVNAPDLVVLQLTDPPPAFLVGESFQVSDTVAERGPVAAAATITGYYLSADRLRGGPDILLGTRTVPGLVVGETSSATSSFSAPPSPGSYYLLACVDDTGLIAEGSETNNCRASVGQVRLTAPDLVETAVLDPPATVAAGASLSVTDSALNQGDGDAGVSTTRYYVSLDTLKDAADVLLLGGRTLPSLLPSGVSTGTVSVTVPAATPTGFYHVLACADGTGQVIESSEPNNCRASAGLVRVTVPDLMETALSDPPASAQAGGSFSASDTVANQGLASSSSSTTRYYLSTDTVSDASDVALSGSRSISTLSAGVSSSGNATVTIPSTAPGGSFRLLACADGNQVVFESNEANNCRASNGHIQVQVRDLVVTSVTNPPASASPNTTFTVTDTTMNQGAVSAGGSTTRYYLST